MRGHLIKHSYNKHVIIIPASTIHRNIVMNVEFG